MHTAACVCYLTCSTGSCRMEYILDLLSALALTFLLSESTAERERKRERGNVPVLWMITGREGVMRMEEERSYSTWLL